MATLAVKEVKEWWRDEREVEKERGNDEFTKSQVLVKAVFSTKEQIHVNAGAEGDLNGMMKTHHHRITATSPFFARIHK